MGTNIVKTGAIYQPELIDLLRTALDEAESILPAAKRTSAMKAKLASRILLAAARGERDPIQLRSAALTEIEDDQTDDIHRCYLQLQRLRKRVEEAEATSTKADR
jgi:hypothetical protein